MTYFKPDRVEGCRSCDGRGENSSDDSKSETHFELFVSGEGSDFRKERECGQSRGQREAWSETIRMYEDRSAGKGLNEIDHRSKKGAGSEVQRRLKKAGGGYPSLIRSRSKALETKLITA